MNKRQKKKQAKKRWCSSYKGARIIERSKQELYIWKKRYDRQYKRCQSCKRLLNCDALFDMNVNKMENCKDFEAEPTSKRLEDMRACAEIGE